MRLYKVQADFGEFAKEYFVTDKPSKIGVMVWHGDRILLVRQYRYILNDMSWELPGGGLVPGESHEAAAKRECFEESGVVCEGLTRFFQFEHSVEAMHAAGYVYSATAKAVPDHPPDNRETDAMKWLAVNELLPAIVSGEIREPMTMIALLKYLAENPAQQA